MKVNWLIDAAILSLLALGMFTGYKKGLIRQVLSIAGFIIAYIVSMKVHERAIPFIQKYVPEVTGLETNIIFKAIGPEHLTFYYYKIIAFIVVLFAVKIILQISGYFFQTVISLTPLKTVDGLGGATFGFIEAYLTLSVALILVGILPIFKGYNIVEHSLIAREMIQYTPKLANEIFTYVMK